MSEELYPVGDLLRGLRACAADHLGTTLEAGEVASLVAALGFTHEDVRALREEWDSEWAGVPRPNDGDALLSIAARIAALLPPAKEGA